MQELPKIARARLSAGAVSEHPDADSLNGFAENALTTRERASVVEHLARCADCRDIVMLALPPMEASEALGKAIPSRASWWSLPVLRWGVVAAAVAVVTTFGILQHQSSRQTTAIALKPQAAEQVADATAPTLAGSSLKDQLSKDQTEAAPVPGKTDRAKPALVKKDTQHVASPSAPADSTFAGFAEPARKSPAEAARAQAAEEKSKAAVAGAERDSSEASAPAAPAAQPPQLAPAQQPDSKQLALSAQGRETKELGTNLKTETVTNFPVSGNSALNEVPGAAPSRSGASGALNRSRQLFAATWSVRPGGGLQRSFDAGKTWKSVTVNEGPINGFGDATAGMVAKARQSKDSDKLLKRENLSSAFRAVVANGSEVWAGGTAGLLVHSADGGESWIRVTPVASGTQLTGDLTALEFPDAQHGKVVTSTSETWTTSDTGQTWQKQ